MLFFDTVRPRAWVTVSTTRGSRWVRHSPLMRGKALHKKSFCTKHRKSAQKGVLLQFEPVPKNDEREAIQTLRLIFQVLPVIIAAFIAMLKLSAVFQLENGMNLPVVVSR